MKIVLKFSRKPKEASPCLVCKNLDPSTFDIREQRPPMIRVNWHRLEQAADGCRTCALLVQVLRKYFALFKIPPRDVRLVYSGTLHIEIGSVKEVMLYSTRSTPWSSINVQGHVTGPTYSEASLDFVKKMLYTCSKEHKLCQPREDVPLPTRLLDLGTGNLKYGTGTVRLWETGNARASRGTRYACLSHCWGEVQPIKTLKENIEPHKKEIRVEDLPRTFADAVNFVRRMGIRYIWIDSLCIVQDDTNDWEREAARMCDIYQNCVICIGAPGSASHSSGLYSSNAVHIKRFSGSLGRKKYASQSPEIFAREPLDHHLLADPFYVPVEENAHDPFTLRFRGWVYQEHMLAPRFVNFLEQELAWSCGATSLCECSYQSNNKAIASSMGKSKISFTSELHSASPEATAFMWRNMVSSYTKLYLSRDTDRLPAIAGIARVFEKKRGSQAKYFSGIWSDSAVQDLAWETWDLPGWKEAWGDKTGRLYNRVNGAPTWSWASVSTWVGYPLSRNDKFESLCKIIDLGEPGFIPALDPSTGQPRKQILVIHGYLIPAKMVYGEEREEYTRYMLQLAGANEASRFAKDDFLNLTDGPSHVQSGATVYYLVLGKDCDNIYYSLVLKVDQSGSMYQRIGLDRNSGELFAGRLSGKSTVRIC
ncbi:HET-domain-containing protein [Bimuria novae-zelandiae CBS 107.79]|uniref:HET-domain-containing protein n=1 Tax=Bimuria novae-zelandiae CBS 107.79 TaxID=1447943 RepID=A0A6A5VTE8_9PLEO|nr:HET-domain-containing protein [Bimuria novae-zelandiae CBS 107.79]